MANAAAVNGCARRIEFESVLGFTLLELLIVIGIVAVLAGLLLSGLANAKSTARELKCKSNLRQIALGMALYVNDTSYYPVFESRSPQGSFLVKSGNNFNWKQGNHVGYWPDTLAPHVGASWTNTVYLCPDYKGVTWPGSAGVLPSGSYGYNQLGATLAGSFHGGDSNPYTLGLGPETANPSDPKGGCVSESEVRVPSEMTALGDTELFFLPSHILVNFMHIPGRNSFSGDGIINFETHLYVIHASDPKLPDFLGTKALAATMLRHRGRHNLAFCDGHIEAVAESKYSAASTGWLQRWNNDHQPHQELLGRNVPH